MGYRQYLSSCEVLIGTAKLLSPNMKGAKESCVNLAFFGRKLGLIGPRFEDCEKLTRRDLRSLRDKFASSLFGFVFTTSAKSFIVIILC